MPQGILFVISAPSGTGKSTLGAELLKTVPGIYYSISVTTRAPRKGEKDGLDYYFITEEEFNRKKDSNQLIEFAKVHGYWYGTPKDFLQGKLKRGQDILLDIDVQGGRQIKTIFPDAVLIFITPPSLEVLETRLRSRRKDDEATIQKRIEAAKNEIAESGHYDYLILNEEISQAVKQLECIVTAERCRMSRNKDLIPTKSRVIV